MSVNLPIGPLQIVLTETNNQGTTTTTGTIRVLDTSFVINYRTATTIAGGVSATRSVNTTTAQTAEIQSDGQINASWSANDASGRSSPCSFNGSFANNLQGEGECTMEGPYGDLTLNGWQAQLGETNVGFTVAGAPGLITIAGTNVTFTLPTVWQSGHAYQIGEVLVVNGFVQKVTAAGTSGGSTPVFSTATSGTTIDNTVTWTCQGPGASSATVALNPATGVIQPTAINLLGYTSVGGTFFSNNRGNGTFFRGAKRQNDSWSTDSGSK